MSGQKAKSVKLYKYSEQLSFLKKYFVERETRSNIGSEELNRDLSGDECDESMVNVTRMENTEQSLQDDDPINPRTTPSKRQKRQKTNPPKTAAATVMEYLVKRNESMNPLSAQSPDPVDAFLNGIAPALKKLPPRYWHYAKAEIFATVQKYEHKMLVDEEERAKSTQFSTPTYSGEPSPSGSVHQLMNMDENPYLSDQRKTATSVQQYFQHFGEQYSKN